MRPSRSSTPCPSATNKPSSTSCGRCDVHSVLGANAEGGFALTRPLGRWIAHHLSRKRLGLTDVAHRCRQRRNTRHRGSQLALLAVQASARRRVKEHGGSIRPWCRRGSRISGGRETRDYFLTDDFVNVRGGRGRP